MKKFFMAMVCLMTMTMSANAQNNDELKKVSNDYKSSIPFDCAILEYDNSNFSKVAGTLTINYNDFGELGNSISIKIKVGDKSAFNAFENVTFMTRNDPTTNKRIYLVADNFGDLLFILMPKSNELANEFNLDTEKYVLVLYNEVLIE